MASVLKVDKLDPQSGTALEIGTSGDTITVPSGATFVVAGTTEITGTNNVQRQNAQPFIINGGMEINQRTGTTATAFTNNVYGIDRWLNYLNGSWAGNYQQIDRSNSVVTDLQTDSGKNFDNVMMIDCTSAASLGASDLVGMLQLIEGYVHNPMAGKAITLSFWVRSTVTGTYCVAFKEGSTKAYVVEYTISSANTWEQKIITLTDDTLANYSSNTSTTSGSSLQLYFGLRLGTTAQQTTADAWNTGNFYGTSDQVTWGTSTSDFFYLAGVQIEMGTYTSSTLPPFRHESYGANLARCQRYFYMVASNSSSADVGAAGYYSTSHIFFNITFPCSMRIAPTVAYQTGTDYYKIIANSATDTFNDILGGGSASTNEINLYNNSQVSGTAGAAGYVRTADTSASIALNSEL